MNKPKEFWIDPNKFPDEPFQISDHRTVQHSLHVREVMPNEEWLTPTEGEYQHHYERVKEKLDRVTLALEKAREFISRLYLPGSDISIIKVLKEIEAVESGEDK